MPKVCILLSQEKEKMLIVCILLSLEKGKLPIVCILLSPEKGKMPKVCILLSLEKEKMPIVCILLSPEKGKVQIVFILLSPEKEKMPIVFILLSLEKEKNANSLYLVISRKRNRYCIQVFLPKCPLTTIRSCFSADKLQICSSSTLNQFLTVVRGHFGRKNKYKYQTYTTIISSLLTEKKPESTSSIIYM